MRNLVSTLLSAKGWGYGDIPPMLATEFFVQNHSSELMALWERGNLFLAEVLGTEWADQKIKIKED